MLEHKSKIKQLFGNITKGDEFEIMFNNYKSDNKLIIGDFINVMKYMKYRSQLDKLVVKNIFQLDIAYSNSFENVFRFSMKDEDNVNSFLETVHQKKNTKIFELIVDQFLDKFELIHKIKSKSNITDFNDYDIRLRKSKEQTIGKSDLDKLKKLSNDDNKNIIFRLKQRLSLEIKKDLHIDLTITKMDNDIKNINNSEKNYELEIDYSPEAKPNDKMLDVIMSEIISIKKVLQQSDHVIKNDSTSDIIKAYKTLMYGSNNNNFNNLYSMQPINAEVQHFVDNIPNKYSVTDKADGDKFVLFIHMGLMYLISNNLNVKLIKTTNGADEIDSTVIEGEYIYLEEKQKYLFMTYDCLYYDGKDLRNEVSLQKRQESMVKALNIIFPKNKYYKIKDYDKDFNINKIKSHYQKEIEMFFDSLDKHINEINKNDILFYPKIFLYPTGASKSEVFLFSILIWNNCTINSQVKCPYVLDGVIYTGIEQKYTRDKKAQKLPIYKFKPPTTNSLDVYIRIEKNNETGKEMEIFDNSLPDIIKDKTFRVVNFYVGDMIGDKEVPVKFMPEQNNHQAFFPIEDGQVRDVRGNLVQDDTVIEVNYNLDSKLPHQYKWKVLRTRWDKTESVKRNRKRYGNFNDIAIRVWKSIKESVTIEEVKNLSNPKNYVTQMKILSSRLNSSIISSQKKQDIYYQKVTNLIKKLREFHNWIKSIIIYTYCSPIKGANGKFQRQSVLDIGCGRGGDILKIYHARVGEYVGFDVDFEGIYSATDGAISRFSYLRKKFPDFGKVTFLQADASALLNPSDQEKALTNISDENKKVISKVFSSNKKYDVITSQFVIHYLFSSSTSIKNLITNIKNSLKKDGYILLTLFDGDIIHSKFNEKGRYTSVYTNEEGQRVKLFEIIKKYDGDLKHKTGQAVDVHMSWISNEDTYLEEYLVSKELLVNTMKLAGCRLVDTDLFQNIFKLNKPYFQEAIKYEENQKNKQFYEKVAQFYGDLKGADKESRDWSFLFRYYVFQKIE